MQLIIYLQISFNLRLLEAQTSNEEQKEEKQKKQLKELFIYLGVFICIIVIILGGYALYKKYLEKKVINELRRENQNYLNFQNSISAPSHNERRLYSFNVKLYNKYQGSEAESSNKEDAKNYSFDYNHEERIEKIRKKYGNKMIINIIIKQQIENIIYNKNLGQEYGDNCTICVNNFRDNMEIYRTPCEHIFHKDCFSKYLKNINKKNKLTCPNCNQNLLINKKFLKLRHEKDTLKIKKIDFKEKIGNNNRNDNSDNEKLNIYNNNDNNNFKNIIIEDNNTMINKENIIVIKKRNKENDIDDIYDNYTTVKNKNRNIYNKNTIEPTMINRNTNIYKPASNLEFEKKFKEQKKEEPIYIEINNNDREISKNSDNVEFTNIMNLNINDNKKKFNKDKIKFYEYDNNNIANIENNHNQRGGDSNSDFIYNKNNFEHLIITKK